MKIVILRIIWIIAALLLIYAGFRYGNMIRITHNVSSKCC